MNKNWLPQYSNEMFVGARNNNMCSYLVALEGWRRGLELKWYSKKIKGNRFHAPGRYFSLSDGNKTHYFYKTKGDKISAQAIKIGANKDTTKKWLTKANIPVPKGKRFFSKDSDEAIIEYCETVIRYPMVIKPTDGVQGRGVIANIQNVEDLKSAITYVRYELERKDIIVESYIKGKEFRFFVIEDKVLAIIERTPANIVGDGIHTVKQLIEIKNRKRKKNPRLFSCLIEIDYEIKKNLTLKEISLDYVPMENEYIQLREKSNISTGGDSKDMLNVMPEGPKQTAIDALKALPKLPHGGVDIIVDLEANDTKGVVLEINAIPQIGSLVFPMEGQARDIPSALIDYYFPKTQNHPRENDMVFFDFRNVLAPLRSKIASEIKVTAAPGWKNMKTIKYNITGKVQNVGYRNWIRKKALEHDLYGSVQYLRDGSVDVIVAGEALSVERFKEVCKLGPKKAKVEEIKETRINSPIKVGFEIKSTEKKRKIIRKRR